MDRGDHKSWWLEVMAGYPEVEDVPAHASEKCMNNVLRQELGFQGVVESEGGGFGTLIYEHIVKTQKEAGALALKAGVDLNITYEPAYMRPLIENVEEGRVPIVWTFPSDCRAHGWVFTNRLWFQSRPNFFYPKTLKPSLTFQAMKQG